MRDSKRVKNIKIKSSLKLAVMITTVMGFLFISGCINGGNVATETIIVRETVIETVIETVEVEKESPYTYEKLREMAVSGAYDGGPAAGYKMAFASLLKSFPAFKSIENNIIEEWQKAGGIMEDLLILDNAANTVTATQNANIIFNEKPEVFLQSQLDPHLNAQLGRKAQELGIFIIAVEVPVLGFPFMGINDYGTSVLTGNWASERINNVYEGWENVDKVFYLWSSDIGDKATMRIYGSMDVLKERFGDEADASVEGTKSVLIDAGTTMEESQSAMIDVLNSYPDAENIVVFCLNDQVAGGVQAAAEISGRWDTDKWIIMSQGLDELGMELIRANIIDGDSAYFPEKYGEYLIPAALAHMHGNPVPAYMFVENVMITSDNIDEYYP